MQIHTLVDVTETQTDDSFISDFKQSQKENPWSHFFDPPIWGEYCEKPKIQTAFELSTLAAIESCA